MTDEELGLGSTVVAAVRAAVAERSGVAPSAVDVRSARRLSGGASRLTWSVVVAPDVTVIVQCDRPGTEGANLSMSTQAAILRAARSAGVPVPEVLADGDDGGAGFVVLERLEGESLPRRLQRDDALTEARARLARDAGRILAAVHSMEHAGIRLPSGDPVEQMVQLLDTLGEPHPAFEIGIRWLRANRPAPVSDTVVHGDFRMGNLLVAPSGVTGVLDWELAHVGSPVEDLGWFCGRAWRFGSPMRAGGVGSAEDLLEGYGDGGGRVPELDELKWWEAYGTVRWGLICVLQASVHLEGHHRSVELAAIGRRAAEAEEDLLELVAGPSAHQPPAAEDAERSVELHDRPSAVELLEAVGEHLDGLRSDLVGAASFHLRVAGNVLAMVEREVALGEASVAAHRGRLAALGVDDDAHLSAAIRSGALEERSSEVATLVRATVRDKLAVANPGYWLGD